MRYRRMRVMAVLAVLAMALAGMAALGVAGTARAAAGSPASSAGVSGSAHPIPYGGSPGQSGVTALCFDSRGYTCAGGGYNGTAAQITSGGGGWSSGTYWSYGSPGPASGTKHNCTTYAAYRIQHNGYAYPGWSGNANQWATKAAAAGTVVDQMPAVGAIAQWNGGSSGHVAYVEAVTATYIETTSDSYDGGTDHLRIARNSPYMPDNFIHFLDTHVGEIVHWNDDPSSPKAAWRVGSDRKRHWIPSESVYECLISGPYGANGPFEMPASWLDSVAPLDSGSTAPCGGDINGDGIVNIKDLSIMASEWGHTGAGLHADVNLDGQVNLSDLSILAAQWQHQPSPLPIVSPSSAANVAAADAMMQAAVTRSVPHARPATPVVVARPAQSDGVGDIAGNASSITPSVSSDGNLVAFSSFATNLVTNDENGSTADIFVWNRSAGTITLASTHSDGTQLTTPSEDAHLSPNGRYVTFDSGGDAWVKDLQTGSLLRISQPNADPGAEPDQAAYADAVTSSGLVIFTCKASNLVSAPGLGNINEVYARQLTNGPVELVSVAPDGTTAAAGDSFGGNASEDGRYVVFSSVAGNLTTGDTNGLSDVFERDLTTGATTLLSVPQGGGQSNGISMFPSISADGSAVAFSSAATDLTANGDPSGFQQVYVTWPSIGSIDQVSQAANGAVGNGDSTEPAISGDGTWVAFRSVAANLVPGDTNYSDDVFVAKLGSRQVSRVSVGASLAQANGSSFGPGINGDGSVVTFPTTASNIGPASSAADAAVALTAGITAAPIQQVVARDIALLPQNPSTATISGTTKVGSTLTAHAAVWQAEGTTLSYQWSANGTPISGATGKTLTLAPAEFGKTITVTITSSEPNFANATATSQPTGKVAAGTLTAPTPTISGTVKAGFTLTAVPGTWKPSGVALHYQWYVNGNAVSSGGTSRTLKLSTTWVGRTVTVKVTGTLTGYATASKTSKPTVKITS